MRFAIVASIIYLALPSWWFLPLSEMYAIGIILYCVRKYPGLDRLGLGRPLPTGAKKAIIIITIVTSALLAGLIVLGMVDRSHAGADQMLIRHQVKYPYTIWAPDNNITDAFAQRDLVGALLYSIKPFILLAILAPIFETIFVFGITFPALFKRFGYRKALWWLTILFTLGHLANATNVIAILIIFISAIAMCILYTETRSLYPSIILHICHNTLIYALYLVVNWGRAKG